MAIYPDISAGSALLAARGSAVADIAKAQNQATENVVKSIQGISDNLQRWQDRVDKQNAAREEREFRAQSFAEQVRANKANEALKDRQIKIDEKLLPARDKLLRGQAYNQSSQGALNSQQKKWGDDFVAREQEAAKKAAEQQGNNTITPIDEAKPKKLSLWEQFQQGAINYINRQKRQKL